MHYIKIKTEHNTIELVVDNYFDKDVQEIINQPYVNEVYLRCIDYELLELLEEGNNENTTKAVEYLQNSLLNILQNGSDSE